MSPLTRMVLRRCLLAVPLALVAATLVFVLVEAAPGSPADVWIGDAPIPQEARERLERAYGLDRPALERYVRWLGALATDGYLGWSRSRGKPVHEAILETLPATMLLAGLALLLHVAVGLALGIGAAARPGKLADRIGWGALVLYAFPTFWLGLVALVVFAGRLGWFPASSMTSIGAEAWPWWRRATDVLWHAALPAAVLGIASGAGLARYVRAGMLDTLGSAFVRAARARGVRARVVLWRHASRIALVPVVNLLGLSLPVLASGSLVIEVVFGWPGMGRLTWNAIRSEDIPLVLGTTLLASGLVIAGSLLADVAMAWLDPRARVASPGEDR